MRDLLIILCSVLVISATAQEWHQDLNTASALSSKEHKCMLVLFSGSDWCVPCMQLKSEILESEIFKTAADNFVLMNADFPRKAVKERNIVLQNDQLAEKHNPGGVFPLIVIIDPNGEKIATLQYDRETPEQFVEKLDRVVQL